METRNPLSSLYEIPDGVSKRALNCIDVFWTKKINLPVNDYDHFNQIIPNLFLGVIPTKQDAASLQKKIPNLGLVVSAVESFEFLNNQTAADWHAIGVAHHHVVIRDYTVNVEIENIFHAVQLIHHHLSQNQAVYVHCKAGKSRSATIVMAYLAIYQRSNDPATPLEENATIKDVYDFMKVMRKQIVIREQHLHVASETVKYFNENRHLPTCYIIDETQSLNKNIALFFASPLTKREISNFLSFKNIKHYAHVKNDKLLRPSIELFFSTILHAEDENWFINMLQGNSHLHILANIPAHGEFLERKLLIGRAKNRLVLIDDFITEMLHLVNLRLNVTKDMLLQLPNQKSSMFYNH